MTQDGDPVYEVLCTVDPDAVDEVAGWLESHAASLDELPCLVHARVLRLASNGADRAELVCHFRLTGSDADIDEFINDPAAGFEASLRERFGDRVSLEARLLLAESLLPAARTAANCPNCGARLRGQYCGECGQRARSRMISLWELLREAFDDLFDVDSRLWRTLLTLLFRPGLLTRDYLRGRQARYMPPFRTYLVLSLLFFIVAFFDPREKFELFFEPDQETAQSEKAAETRERRRQILRDLADEGILIPESRSAAASIETSGSAEEPGGTLNIDARCDIESMRQVNLSGWLARRLTPERLQQICERVLVDSGRALINNLLETIPAALIVLLPIMAFVLRLLYPLSRRYYVEHLLFFVHVHAFFFLILTLEVLFARGAALVALPGSITTLLIVAGVVYIPVYLFVAMRRVYRQGRLITGIKYVTLTVAYLAGLQLTMLGSLAVAAFSI